MLQSFNPAVLPMEYLPRVLDASDDTVTHVSDRLCHIDREMRVSLAHHD